MDAVQYLITVKRICSLNRRCIGCPLDGFCNGNYEHIENPEKMVARVQEWAKEHPIKKKRSAMLKAFLNAIDYNYNGDMAICPRIVNKDFECRCGETTCHKCMNDYWFAEVEEDDDEHS